MYSSRVVSPVILMYVKYAICSSTNTFLQRILFSFSFFRGAVLPFGSCNCQWARFNQYSGGVVAVVNQYPLGAPNHVRSWKLVNRSSRKSQKSTSDKSRAQYVQISIWTFIFYTREYKRRLIRVGNRTRCRSPLLAACDKIFLTYESVRSIRSARLCAR